MNAHYPALFLGGFLFFLGFARATAAYQSRIELKAPLLVGFFLARPGDPRRAAGLVDRAGARQPVRDAALFRRDAPHRVQRQRADHLPGDAGAELSANAMKAAVVEGAVTGGGLTVIANAPNPAGQAILGKFFGNAIEPLWLAVAALLPTLITIVAFRFV